MEEIFPSMNSKPDRFNVFARALCWFFVFVAIPRFLPYLGLGIWDKWELSAWLEIAYHVIIGFITLWLMHSYLKEEWFMVSTDIRYYLKHIALTVVLMMGTELWLLSALSLCGFDIEYMKESLPVVEMSISHTPLFLLSLEPVFGTLVLSVFAPISVCILFYCFGFAPVCYRKPWLAYLCIVVLTLLPPVVDILWRGQTTLALSAYLAGLPIHLLACWSYQKTDNVWTPMLSLAITNLLVSLVQLLLL